MIDLVLNNCTKGRAPSQSHFARICAAAEPFLKVPKGHRGEVGITLVPRARIRTLNRQRRRVDKPTDVLSFPLHMAPIKGYTSVLLGDLFICPDVVRAHARESGMSLREQMSWTVVHGLLHLAGYDHERGAAAAKRMRTAERAILKKVGGRR
jgi:rRNA maturation RNase YbeY